ncbi:MAG: antitoxin [Acidobacteriia bacterium]|nr:antitoxin [Terriglobia bacterium]
MRTTVAIDDDVLAIARALAQQNAVSLGRALSELARRGQHATAAVVESDGLPGFAVPRDTKPITSDEVYKALGEWL